MGIFDKLRAELIDIIEWIDDSQHTLAWRFPRYQNEIKNGAQLIVRPGQMAVFVREGRIADVFDPGTYELTTENLPLMSTLAGWKHGFNSPFKSEVYFVSTKVLTDMKWGTPNPIMMRDADFGPVRLRAFGIYTLRTIDPRALIRELVGTNGVFNVDEVHELLRSLIASSFADALGKAEIAALDIAGKYVELGDALKALVNERIDDEYGLEIPELRIVNVALPEAVEKALDTRTQMGVIGDLGRYQQYQMANALTAAANNPAGGGASEGMGLGMGLAMANQMMGAMGGRTGGAPPVSAGGAPPPPPTSVAWHVARGGTSTGPFNTQQVVQAIQQGQVNAATTVWNAGLGGWRAAGQVPELAHYFAPPPPPPAG